MKKIYQDIIDKEKGNCASAAIASMLDKELADVPYFYPDDSQFGKIISFMKLNGYEYIETLHNKNYNLIRQSSKDYCFSNIKWYEDGLINHQNIKKFEGIDGLFYAGVLSPLNFNINDGQWSSHAVVVDKNFNIVHDPNPMYKDLLRYPLAELIEYNGITDIDVFEKIKL